MKALLNKKTVPDNQNPGGRPSQASRTQAMNDSGIQCEAEALKTDELTRELEEEKMKCSSLFQEVQSLRKEIDDLNHKLELAVRGRPSSGDLSSEAVLFMVEKQMQGMTLFDTAKLQALLANTLTLENLDSINMEAAEGEKKLMELYESLN